MTDGPEKKSTAATVLRWVAIVLAVLGLCTCTGVGGCLLWVANETEEARKREVRSIMAEEGMTFEAAEEELRRRRRERGRGGGDFDWD